MTTFREASRADLAAIVSLLEDDPLAKGREDASPPLNSRYLDAWAAVESNPDQMILVAEDEGVIAGTLQINILPGLSRLGATRGQLEAVRVAASHRRRGLGEKLVQRAVELCRERGCTLVELTSDKSRLDAHRFYERLGFAASHEGFKLHLE